MKHMWPAMTIVVLAIFTALMLGAAPTIQGPVVYMDRSTFNGIATGSLPTCGSGVANNEGGLTYDSTTKTMKWCNGTSWATVGGDFSNIASDILPATDLTYNLGSSTKTWSALFTQSINDSAGQVRQNIQESQPTNYYGNSSDGVGAVGHKFSNITSITASDTRYAAWFYRDSVTNRVATIDTNGNYRRSATAFAAPTVHGTADTTAKDIETGTSTFSTGTKAITFTTAFGANPNCVCTTTSATVPCSISVNPSTTGVTFAGTGSDTFWYECMGNR